MRIIISLIFTAAALRVGPEAFGVDETDNFNANSEGWQIYDYDGGVPGQNSFYPVTWQSAGGVGDSGYIWGDDSRWRIDTPEDPHSILAFIVYRTWVGGGPLDLRNAEVPVHLRGDDLDLKGAQIYFWALDQEIGTRWHYVGNPLTVSDGAWSDGQNFTLVNDENQWHRTWARNPTFPASLDNVLTDSYGFSFLGFSGEVTGTFAMDELVIVPEPAWTLLFVVWGGALTLYRRPRRAYA